MMRYGALPGKIGHPAGARTWELTVQPLEGPSRGSTSHLIRVMAHIKKKRVQHVGNHGSGMTTASNRLFRLQRRFLELPENFQEHFITMMELTLKTIRGKAVLGKFDETTHTLPLQHARASKRARRAAQAAGIDANLQSPETETLPEVTQRQ